MKIYWVEFKGKKYEFSYEEYVEKYICLEEWSDEIKQLNSFLKKESIKTTVDVCFEKTIIIDKEEFETKITSCLAL
jgi:tRNA A37 threonylcarbamoyladenosine biosynthesis protein TsaE